MEDIKSHYKRFRETFLLDYSETLPSETINKLKARVIEERDQQKEKNETYKQSSAQNFKINEIAENLKSGKIVGEKIISNALSYASEEYTGSSYCFIDPKDLETQLVQYKQDLLNDIIIEINQIKIEYNLLDEAFYFIFDIVNFLDEKLEFIIEVPREALDLENIDRLVEKNHSHGSLARHVREGYFILDTHLKE
ncbi:hypothetical protein C2R64_06740 [Helicobacter pylori]|nr:hypothetical protein C2R64_06740 [Helicobacter pylori]WRG94812.1 hypothetical protein FNE14_04440 [Helicobacter pylori]